ncbi:hypothetical protein Dimus_025809 [Dionaea muscipula]
MNVLNTPLESLLFFDASAVGGSVVHNVWTWIALISAVFSFWGFRLLPSASSSSPSSKPPPPTSHPFATSRLVPSSSEDSTSTTTTSSSSNPIQAGTLSLMLPTTSFCTAAVRVDEKTRCRKFTVVYCGDLVVEEDEREEVGGGDLIDDGMDGGDDGGDELVRRWGAGGHWGKGDHRDNWGVGYVVEMRMGDMGWYRCQDLSVLDGSVIRLWDRARGCCDL